MVGPDPWWVPPTKALLYAAIATLTVGTLVLGCSHWYARMLGNRPMVWLGEISYEIFLLHVVVMAVTLNLVLRWPLFTGSLPVLYATTIAVTIPMAWGLHRLTRPARAAKQARVTQAITDSTPAPDARPRPSPPETARQPCVTILRG